MDISFLLRPRVFWPQRESSSKPVPGACAGATVFLLSLGSGLKWLHGDAWYRRCCWCLCRPGSVTPSIHRVTHGHSFLLRPSLFWPQRESSSKPVPGGRGTLFPLSLCNKHLCAEMLGIGVAVGAFVGLAVISCLLLQLLSRPHSRQRLVSTAPIGLGLFDDR